MPPYIDYIMAAHADLESYARKISPHKNKSIKALASVSPKANRAVASGKKTCSAVARSIFGTDILVAQGKTDHRMSEMKRPEKSSPGLGELVRTEGSPYNQESDEKPVASKCSCEGENANCFNRTYAERTQLARILHFCG